VFSEVCEDVRWTKGGRGKDLAESVFTGGCWDCHAREWIYGIAGMNVILWLLTQAKRKVAEY
jgi:hypothetical protein